MVVQTGYLNHCLDLYCERAVYYPAASTEHLYKISTTSPQHLRRWSNIPQMLYKWFVFAGYT